MNVIQGARINGATTIVALDKVQQKADEARAFGATHAATPGTIDSIKTDLTGGHGFDYVFEVIGLSATIRAALDHTRRGGTTCVVGVGRADDNVQISALEFLRKAPTILGCVYGSSHVGTDFNRFLDHWKKGELNLDGLITKRIALEDVPSAFQAIENGEVIRQVIEF
jgi:S-(hydroxymethyl)glutathione dehydrogenase/alcohol dehydrogenase